MASSNRRTKHSLVSDEPLKILKAGIDDAIPFLRLEARCFEMEFSNVSLYYWRPVIDYCYAFKAVYKNNIIGGAMAMPTRDGRIYVSSLFVHPHFRRTGLGTKLLKRVLAQRSAKGHILDVKDDRPYLVSFYLRHGFKRISTKRNYYRDGSDRIIMVRFRERIHGEKGDSRNS